MSLGTPFADPVNAVGDVVRLFVIIGGTIQMGMFIKFARYIRNTRQWGAYALICYGVSAIGTEIEQLGHIVTYRLLFNTAGVVFGIVFLVKTRVTRDLDPVE